MSESILFYNPDAFTAYQNCTCTDSRMIDDVRFEQGDVIGDKVKVVVVSSPMICSVCKTPYRLMVDTRRVGIILVGR